MGYYGSKYTDKGWKNERRREKFAKVFMMTNRKDIAAKEAGFPSTTEPSNIAKGKKIRQSMQDIANLAGLSIEACAATIASKLSAQRAIVVDKSVEFVDDNMSQLKAAELGLKVHGLDQGKDESKGSEAVLDFCRAYWKAKSEAMGEVINIVESDPGKP